MKKYRNFSYPISVLILYYGGTTGDMLDTLESVKALTQILKKRGHLVRCVEVTRQNWRKAVRGAGDVVFNLVEDETYELYMKVARALHHSGKAQVGISYPGLRYAVRKAMIKRRMKNVGIPTPNFRILNKRSKVAKLKRIEYPLIVKPSGQHAGIGISQDSVVIDQTELEERVDYLRKYYPGEVLVEEYIEGREIQVTVLGNGNRLVVLPPAEIVFGGEYSNNWDIYSYESKWGEGSWEYNDARVVSPPAMSRKLAEKIDKIAALTFRSFHCCDVARFDLRIDDRDNVYVVDVNMSPSLNTLDEQDATLASAIAAGLSDDELIEKVVAISYKRVYGRLPDRIRDRTFLLPAPRLI